MGCHGAGGVRLDSVRAGWLPIWCTPISIGTPPGSTTRSIISSGHPHKQSPIAPSRTLQDSLTNDLFTPVTHEVAGSSPVVPAIASQ